MSTYQTTAPCTLPVMQAVPGTMERAKVNVIDEVEGQIAAVILAALAEECGGSFTVISIEKSKNICAASVPVPMAQTGPGTMEKAKVNVVDEVEGQTAAVILVALAEECGGNFSVKSIKKS